jgi:hypothetical protein
MDRLITHWLSPVFEVRDIEPSSRLPVFARRSLEFQVLTPVVQRQLDQSA